MYDAMNLNCLLWYFAILQKDLHQLDCCAMAGAANGQGCKFDLGLLSQIAEQDAWLTEMAVRATRFRVHCVAPAACVLET